MPTNRKVVFANGEYYHLFNRGVEKRLTFTNKFEFQRALELLKFYRFGNLSLRYSKYLALDKEKRQNFLDSLKDGDKIIEIISFCLMGNHFHLLVKQLKSNGISKFMANFTNAYTKYFNTKHKRVGPLFQGLFKAVHVESDEQLLHLSRYIHLNPVTGFIIKPEELKNYQWSSYPSYLNLESRVNFVDIKIIGDFFKSASDYEEFVINQVDYARQLKIIEHLSFE